MYYALVLLVTFIVLCIWAYLSHASKKYMRDAISNIQGPYCIPLLGALQAVYKLDYKSKCVTV